MAETLKYELKTKTPITQIKGYAYVASYPGKEFEIREFELKIPKFYPWIRMSDGNLKDRKKPEGNLTFQIRERAGRFLSWLETRLVCSVSAGE